MAGKKWTDKEEKILVDKANKCKDDNELAQYFPDRSVVSVRTRRERMKLSLFGQRTEWSSEEIELLREHYPCCNEVKDIVYLFPNRSEESLKRMAQRMRDNGDKNMVTLYKWTDEEEEILKNNYCLKTNLELANLLGKTDRSIAKKLSTLNLVRSSEYRSMAQTGENNNFYKHQHTDEFKKKQKENVKKHWEEVEHPWIGRKQSIESKEKMKINALNNPNHYKHFKKGMKIPEWWRKKMMKEKKWTVEGKEKLRRLAMERDHFARIPYICLNGETVMLQSTYEERIAKSFDNYRYEWKRNLYDISVDYYDANNIKRVHYPDFVVWKDGIEYYIETKGENFLVNGDDWNNASPNTFRKLKEALKKWGDRYLLISSNGISEFEKNGWADDKNIIYGPSHPEVVEYWRKKGINMDFVDKIDAISDIEDRKIFAECYFQERKIKNA